MGKCRRFSANPYSGCFVGLTCSIHGGLALRVHCTPDLDCTPPENPPDQPLPNALKTRPSQSCKQVLNPYSIGIVYITIRLLLVSQGLSANERHHYMEASMVCIRTN